MAKKSKGQRAAALRNLAKARKARGKRGITARNKNANQMMRTMGKD